jgi:hypothetical protein
MHDRLAAEADQPWHAPVIRIEVFKPHRVEAVNIELPGEEHSRVCPPDAIVSVSVPQELRRQRKATTNNHWFAARPGT